MPEYYKEGDTVEINAPASHYHGRVTNIRQAHQGGYAPYQLDGIPYLWRASELKRVTVTHLVGNTTSGSTTTHNPNGLATAVGPITTAGASADGGMYYCPYVPPTEPTITPINKPTKMNKLSQMMKKLLDKDTQKLVKAGYINGDLDLTEAGKKALWGIIFTEYKEELVAVADAELKEAEEERKKCC